MALNEESLVIGALACFTAFLTYICHRIFRPQLNRLLVQFDSAAGASVAIYAWFIEQRMKEDPLYVPGCNSFGGSCATVLTSSHAHILSHWGILPVGHVLDLSLSEMGVLLYSTYFVAISLTFRVPFREQLFLASASAGACFSMYLSYVIKYVLEDFCIVCFSFHVCNFWMLGLAIREYNAPQVAELRCSKRKSR